jgi:hypothetical protein
LRLGAASGFKVARAPSERNPRPAMTPHPPKKTRAGVPPGRVPGASAGGTTVLQGAGGECAPRRPPGLRSPSALKRRRPRRLTMNAKRRGPKPPEEPVGSGPKALSQVPARKPSPAGGAASHLVGLALCGSVPRLDST